MIDHEVLDRMKEKYPPSKPIVLNYVQMRGELLAFASRVIYLEEKLAKLENIKMNGDVSQ